MGKEESPFNGRKRSPSSQSQYNVGYFEAKHLKKKKGANDHLPEESSRRWGGQLWAEQQSPLPLVGHPVKRLSDFSGSYVITCKRARSFGGEMSECDISSASHNF